MNIEKIRKDFPLLQEKINNKPIIYFDNACSSLKPLSVIEAMDDYYRKYPVCGGRSIHKLSEIVTEKVAESRATIARFIGARDKEEIVFTRNATEGINLVAKSLNLKSGDIVLTSDKEHNSNLIPWHILVQKIGIIYKVVPSREDNTFDLEKFEEMMEEIGDRVKLVSVVHTSNLDGVSFPVDNIIKISHRYGAKVLLDSAQSAPHKRIDVSKSDVDFLVFSGHKMLGPSGTGALYGKYSLLGELDPFLVGGSTVEYSTYEDHKFLPPPEKFEAGLQDYAGIIGFGEAIKYLSKMDFDEIEEREYELNKIITDGISGIPRLKIIGPADSSLRGGIVSFYIDDIDSHKIAIVLNESSNIMIRSGQHCAHSWFNAHNIKNSARASLYFYNTDEEARVFVESLNKLVKIF